MKYIKEREDLSLKKSTNRKTAAMTGTRYIPTSIKQEVWRRDNGRCAFVGVNNKRCNSDYLIQFDHHPVPYARGGSSTVDNLRLLCAKHNRHTAEKTYGREHVEKFIMKEPAGVYQPWNSRIAGDCMFANEYRVVTARLGTDTEDVCMFVGDCMFADVNSHNKRRKPLAPVLMPHRFVGEPGLLQEAAVRQNTIELLAAPKTTSPMPGGQTII